MKRIAYLGPEGTYSYFAAKKMGKGAQLVPVENFPLIFKALISGEVDFAVLPIENTLNGGVLQNLDLLQSTQDVFAFKSVTIRVDHRLAMLPEADPKKITAIYSHPQALAQCSKFLNSHFPHARLLPTTSTGASVKMITSPECAGIVSAHASVDGLKFYGGNIADEKHNYTRFLLVRKGRAKNAASSRIYFCATLAHKPGSLYDFLHIIYCRGLNMTKIESRPVKDKPGEYRFFIEIEANYKDDEVKTSLAALKSAANSFKLLGCY